ncbi:hypothetical protein Tco_0313721, partial [Tanacetum coccineum]
MVGEVVATGVVVVVVVVATGVVVVEVRVVDHMDAVMDVVMV